MTTRSTIAPLCASALLLLVSTESVADWQFTEVTESAGINAQHGLVDESEPGLKQMSGGVAVGDYDNDGDADLYVITGDAGPNRLYRNNADGTFTDVAAEAGVKIRRHVGAGPAFADIDMDGDLDLTVGGVGGSGYRVFINDGNGIFEEDRDQAGIFQQDERQNDYSTAFGDPDGDGDLDAVIAHWGAEEPTNHIWLNMGQGNFVPGDAFCGITAFETKDWSFSPVFTDIDGDGRQDLLMASDYGYSEVMINRGDAVFEVITDRDVINDENGMGQAAADFDNDGDIDWFVTSIHDDADTPTWAGGGNRLYMNFGNGQFENVSGTSGIIEGGWGWGACAADFDNDGLLDLFHVNGFPNYGPTQTSYEEDPSRLFRNIGNGRFEEISTELGLIDTDQGRGVSCLDYDLDGDIDLFVANWNAPASLWRNDLVDNPGWLQVRLDGSASVTQVAGAVIEVVTGPRTQMREVTIGSNFESQNPLDQHFGLGGVELNDGVIDEVRVRWPYGGETVLEGVEPNQRLVISPDSATPPPFAVWPGMSSSWFDPDRNGEGFVLEILPNGDALAYFFTYDANGNQDWYIMVGRIYGGRISFPEVLRVTGGVFGPGFDPTAIDTEVVGSAGFSWSDDSNGQMDWYIDGVHGRMNLLRITEKLGLFGCNENNTAGASAACADTAALSGSWFDPTHNGEGYVLEMLNNGQALVYWFTYGPEGDRRWFLGLGDEMGGVWVFEDLLAPNGPVFGAGYDADDLATPTWGRLELDIDCSGGTASYQAQEDGFGSGQLDVIKLTTLDGLACPEA